MIGTAALFWRMRRCSLNGLHQAWRAQRLRLLSGIGVLLLVWVVVYALTAGLFSFLDKHYPEFQSALVHYLTAMLFSLLSLFVTVSATIIIWSQIFRTESGRFLAQLPVSNRALYWHAAVEGGVWASWPLVMLGMPILIALHPYAAQPWGYVPAALITLICFQCCCMSLGATGAIILARIIPFIRMSMRGMILAGLLAATGITVFVVDTLLEQGPEPIGFVRQMIAQFGFIDSPYHPASWVAQALHYAQQSEWVGWLQQCLLLLGVSGLIAMVGEWGAARRLRREFDLLTGRVSRQRSRSKPWKLIPYLPRDLAIMVAKDMRSFVRDSAQMLQMGLFVLMLGFYIALLPRIGLAFQSVSWWSQVVSVLNICAVSMAIATFTGRFVYPMMSLEGRRMWVLALAPWDSQRLVLAKFSFAVIIAAPVGFLLIFASGKLLDIRMSVVLYQAFLMLGITTSLAASAIALGTRYANYREDNPTRLVSSYGGTLNLLLSLVIVAGCLLGASMPLIGYGSGDSWILGVLWSMIWCLAWTMGMLRLAFSSYRKNLNGG